MRTRRQSKWRDVVGIRDFRNLLLAYLIDESGSWAYTVVLAVYVVQRTGSTEWLAAVSASRWITGILVGGYAGVISDRYERTTVMKGSAWVSAAVMAAMTAGVAVNGPLVVLLALSAVAAAVGSPYGLAAAALRPDLVPENQLVPANAVFATLENLVVVAGPAVGGLLLLTGKPWLAMAINTATFVVAAVLVRSLHVRSVGEPDNDSGTFAMMWDGVRVLAQQRTAIVLMLFGALAGSIYAASTVVFVPLSGHVGLGRSGYTYLLAASSLGSVLAAGIADRLSARARMTPVILLAIGVQALPFLATAWVHESGLAIVLQILSGTGFVVVDLISLVAVQRDLPRETLSRGFAVWQVIVLVATLTSSFATASLISAEGLKTTLVVIGVVFPALSLLGIPALLRSDRESAARVEALRPCVELLEQLDLFTDMDRAGLEQLAEAAVVRRLAADELLMKQGDTADALWLLADGALSVTNRVDGRTRRLPDVVAPAYVGELGLLHHVPRTATVRGRDASELYRIDGQDFVAALDGASASASLISLVGVRLQRTPSAGSTLVGAGRTSAD